MVGRACSGAAAVAECRTIHLATQRISAQPRVALTSISNPRGGRPARRLQPSLGRSTYLCVRR
jgi:hypothetical protein